MSYFSNPSSYSYQTKNCNGPVASNAEDDEITVDNKLVYDNKLFNDVKSLWQQQNYERQFYSSPDKPSSNNQPEFARWLYGNASQRNGANSQ